MKHSLFITVLAAFSAIAAAAQPPICMEEGTVLEYAVLNGKGKPMGYVKSTVDAVEQSDTCTLVTLMDCTYDKNHEPSEEGDEFTVYRVGETRMSWPVQSSFGSIMPSLTVIPDLDTYMRSQQAAFSKGESGSEDIVIPYDGEPGTMLPSYKYWEKYTKIGIDQAKLDVAIIPKFMGRETVKTAAGEFDCIVIHYDMDFNIEIMAQFQGEKLTMVEWRAPGIGVVKSGAIDKKGEVVEGSVELQKIVRP